MPGLLLPIAEIVRIKRRPETTLSLREALATPAQTVDDYVFTDAIRNHFDRILGSVQGGRGQGFWVQGEYGGGKTHFLATLAALLEGDERIWDAVHDDAIRNFAASIRQARLFPVVFSLRGQSAAGLSRRRRLYDVLEEQIEAAAHERLGSGLNLNSAEELLAWYRASGPGVRGDLDTWVKQERQLGIEALLADAGQQVAADVILAATEALKIRPGIAASTVERLRRAYKLVVEQSGRYNGLLVIMDEFAFWQQQHPEGTEDYAHDEEVLETLAWVLRHDYQLPIYTVVASQMPPPVKLSGAEGDRFEVLDVLRGESQEAKTRDYQRIVSHRVREIPADSQPDVYDYLQHYRTLFEGRFPDEPLFREAFPIERHAYEILQLLTQSLAAERVGINVVWEVLGRQTADPDHPEPSVYLYHLRRLVIAADLLQSPTLLDELSRPMFASAVRARDALLGSLARLNLGEELPLAERIVATLFLWYLASRRTPRPMSIQELAEATLIESDIYGSPENAVLSLIGELHALRQIEFDQERNEIAFKVNVAEGPDPATIFADYRARAIDGYYLEKTWRDALTERGLRDETTSALFAGMVPDQPSTLEAVQRGVAYRVEYLLASDWTGKLGEALTDRRLHGRVIYLPDPRAVEASQLYDPRVAVVIPAPRAESQNQALRDFAAYKLMEEEYGSRTEPEAFACRTWLQDERQQREIVGPLLRAQREVYRAGEIVTRDAIGIDPRQIFQPPDSEPRRSAVIAERLLADAYRERPFAGSGSPQPIKGSVPSQLFNGFFASPPTPAARDAVKNYAPSLELSKPARPDRLDAGDAKVFAILRGFLKDAQEHGGQGAPVYRIYDQLWRLGVPEDLVSLYLLVFVYSTAEGAELTLKSEVRGRLKLTSGARLPDDRITAATIRQLDFSSLQPQQLDLLVPRQGETWDETLPWLKQFDGSLGATSDPERINAFDQKLTGEISELVTAAAQALSEIGNVAQRLGQQLPESMTSPIEALKQLAGASGYQQIYDRARDAFAGEAALAEATRLARSVRALNETSAQIVMDVEYLEKVPAERLPAELRTERELLQRQFQIDGFVRSRGSWDGVAAQFEEWRRRYQNEYTKFLRGYFREAQAVRERAGAIEQRLAALTSLEEVLAIPGPEQAGELRQRWQGLLGSLPAIPFEIGAVDLQVSPVCAHHGVPFGAPSLEQAAAGIETDLTAALNRRLDVLRGETVRRLLSEPSSPAAERIAAALGVQDDASWIRLLSDPEQAREVRQLLGSIETRELRLLDGLREKFPTITRANLDAAVAVLRQELIAAIEQAERERGDGVTVEVTLR